MPTYSYRCTECDNAFDIHQAFTDDTLTVCPGCGGKLRKVFSPVGITFSGSGFYRTDSRATPRSGLGSESSSSSDSGASSATSAAAPTSTAPKKESGAASTAASTSSSPSGSTRS